MPGVIGSAGGQTVRDDDASATRREAGSRAGSSIGLVAPQVSQPSPKDAANVIRERAFELRRQGQFREASQLFQRQLAVVESDPRATPAQRAAATHNLGEVFLQLGKYGEADALLTKAAGLWGETADAASSAATLFQLGHLRRLQGRYDEASATLRRANEICQGTCQSGGKRVISLALWGDLFVAQGRLAEAEAAYTQAKERMSNDAGEAVQVDIWSGLAMVYRRQARYREAEYAARRSIALARKGFGEQHVRVAVGVANLGLIQAFRRKYSAARKSLEDALARMEHSAGPDSTEAAAILSNLALVNQQTGRVAAAESLLRRALAINTESYGPEHPSVAAGLASLGVLALERGELWSAEELLRKALLLTEKSLGENHLETASILTHLGLTLAKGGRSEQASNLFERALSIRKRALGEQHPDVAVTMVHWAAALRANGRDSDAARIEKDARKVHSARARDGATGYTVDVETLLRDFNVRY